MTAMITTTGTRGIALLDVEKARALLSKSKDLVEIRELKDKAKTVEVYLRAKNAAVEAQQDAAEIRLRAERRLGELIADMPKAKGGGDTRGAAGAKSTGTRARPVVPQPPTLADRGIRKQDAAKFQQLAAIPVKKFDALLDVTRKKGERITASAPLKLVRQEAKSALARELRAKPVPMPDGRFDVIAIDDPWPYEKRKEDTTQRGQTDYPTMTIEQICAVPVADRANENCILWMWTTNAHILTAAPRVLAARGFSPVTMLTWDKGRIGTGDWLRGQTEHCILAIRGNPIVQLTNQSTIIHEAPREPGRKPEKFYKLVEDLCPGTKLEMFSRTPREGWATWGGEAEKFGRAA
jgi:N6-adenosine-specific RNA methylase IME4